ncbi:MAG: hypothetical protein ACREOJ_03725, partial [Gemmatimonadaceae bacterium]
MSVVAAPRLPESGDADGVVPRGANSSFRSSWRESYGNTWWLDLAILGAIVFLLGAVQPLNDPDLPMHLATGEWIVRHGMVPFTEPFAWTRMGAPFFAYSWALEVPYYLVLRWVGPLGLHLLNGFMMLAAGASVLVLGHAARWKPWVSLCLAGYGIGVAVMVVSSLRPQLLLLSLVPLAWAFTYQMLERERVRWAAVCLIATSALAANTHLFFVLTAVPVVLCWIQPPADGRRIWAVCGCILGGWLLSPYALVWPQVFALNFGHNALVAQPSPIMELRPGFNSGVLGIAFAAALALIPWAMQHATLSPRERLTYAALWLAGLVGFGMAGRLLLAWWLIVLPAAAAALAMVGRREQVRPPRLSVRVTTYAAAVLCMGALVAGHAGSWREEGTVVSRTLPSPVAPALDPLAAWLQCHTLPGAHGRIYTWFNYGSYLVWRMPAYSSSIDGRGIFPDSVAQVEALTSGWIAPRTFTTWSSADIAIIPRRFNVASVIGDSPAWGLVAWDHAGRGSAGQVGLWVRRDWWANEGRGPFPEQ